jgi:multidrug resistance efflux pump
VRNRAELSKADSDYKRVQKLFEAASISDAERNSAQTKRQREGGARHGAVRDPAGRGRAAADQ